MRDLQTITLRELLPPSIAGDPDILAAADAVDAELRKATACIPNVSIIPRIREIVDSTIIDLLAWQFHVDFYEADAPLETRRELVARSLDWHTRKGTPSVVEEVVTAALSDAEVSEWFNYDGEPYFFRVQTEMPLAEEEEIRRLIDAIYSVKNTRSWLEFIEAITKAWLRLYFAAGVAILDMVDVSLRSPDAPPFTDGKIESTEIYMSALALIRGWIVTYSEPYDVSVMHVGVYDRIDGIITTRGEQA